MLSGGNYARAITCIEKALTLKDRTDEQALFKLQIKAYEYAGDFAKAKELMRAYSEAYPKDASMEDEAIFLETR